MPTPCSLIEIASALHDGRRRRAKVRTIMGYYDLKRRRSEGMMAIRADLQALGLKTEPDFETDDFDEQVYFVPADGSGALDADEPAASNLKLYRVEFQPGSERKFRVLMRTYDAYERFRQQVVSSRCAAVLQNGQNPRRKDRDLFPFYAVVELVDPHRQANLEEWLEDATRLGQDELPDAAELQVQVNLLSSTPPRVG